MISLFLIGTLNILNLLRTKQSTHDHFQISGIKGKFLPRIAKETTNPFLVILIGALFAMAADTVSQTSMWAMAAGNSGGYMPFILGITFMIGIMLTDTIDSLVAYRMINQSGKLGRSTSRLIGWIIVALAYGVSFYEAFTFFFPGAELDYEIIGTIIFVLMVLCFTFVNIQAKRQKQAA